MERSTALQRRSREALARPELEVWQVTRLNALLDRILPQNGLYREKLAGRSARLHSLQELQEFPFTHKEELQRVGSSGLAAASLTFPVESYVRYHQTSGTRGRALVVLDTEEDWDWWLECWQYVLDAANVTSNDRVMMAFSFGPFIGFWSAHDAVIERGCLVVPGGGLSTLARLQMLRSSECNVVFCTPSYALHMAEVAARHQLPPSDLNVRTLILAGEPGGSIPAVRARIEEAWQAKVFDHSGASEIGPWGYADRERRGLYINEAEFIAEFLSLEHAGPAREGELAELVLTNLGRFGFPVIRYRTRDLVRARYPSGGENRFVLLEGGVLGRTDDMLIIRGVNVFPSAVEQILRSFPEVHEYRIVASRVAEMDQLTVDIEDRLEQPRRVAEELRMRLGLRIDVRCVPLGSLPRFEAKGTRFVDERR